ncbi:MAG TPA: zinc ribbon domain-containing protein [Bacteroidota bacterium]|nr:zinc ribbon domain-containing protein [Bacteroidota bacterium]
MPIYEYRCKSCGTQYDVLHKGREIAEDLVCPNCRSTEQTRLISATRVAVNHAETSAPSCAPGGCCGGSCGVD